MADDDVRTVGVPSGPERGDDEQDDQDYRKEFERRFTYSQTAFAEWRDQARKFFDTYAGDPWPEEAKEIMDAEGRPRTNFNYALSTANTVLGQDMSDEKEATFKCAVELGDFVGEFNAENLTRVVRHVYRLADVSTHEYMAELRPACHRLRVLRGDGRHQPVPAADRSAIRRLLRGLPRPELPDGQCGRRALPHPRAQVVSRRGEEQVAGLRGRASRLSSRSREMLAGRSSRGRSPTRLEPAAASRSTGSRTTATCGSTTTRGRGSSPSSDSETRGPGCSARCQRRTSRS